MMENNINQTKYYIYQTYEKIFKSLSNSNFFTNNNHLMNASQIQSVIFLYIYIYIYNFNNFIYNMKM